MIQEYQVNDITSDISREPALAKMRLFLLAQQCNANGDLFGTMAFKAIEEGKEVSWEIAQGMLDEVNESVGKIADDKMLELLYGLYAQVVTLRAK